MARTIEVDVSSLNKDYVVPVVMKEMTFGDELKIADYIYKNNVDRDSTCNQLLVSLKFSIVSAPFKFDTIEDLADIKIDVGNKLLTAMNELNSPLAQKTES